MKYLLIFGFLISSLTAGKAQTKPCSLTVENSPDVRGIKLGMTKKQFGELTGRAAIGNFIFLREDELGRLENFRDLSELNAIFNNQNLLDSFGIKYDRKAVKWKNGKDFARYLSNDFGLPNEAWNFFSTENGEAILGCKDFNMEIYLPINQVLIKSLTGKNQPNSPQNIPRKIFQP